jgi:hypothetical protein
MKTITIKTLLVISIVIISITISCKKKTENAPTIPTGNLWFHLHSDASDSIQNSDFNVTPNVGPIDATGRQLCIDTAQLLISNVQLLNSSGEVVYTVPNSVVFKVPLTETYSVGQVPASNFTAVKYTIGLDSVTNSMIPPASDSALYNNKAMYYEGGSSPQPGGYTFIYFSGYIDTTTGATAAVWNGYGTPPTGFAHFSYKIGGNKNLGTVTMPANPGNVSSTNPSGQYTVLAGQTTFVHQVINYYRIFFTAGFPINNAANLTISPSNPNPTIAKMILNNIVTGDGLGHPSNETWYYEQGTD